MRENCDGKWCCPNCDGVMESHSNDEYFYCENCDVTAFMGFVPDSVVLRDDD